MESSATTDSVGCKTVPANYEVTIWCTVHSENEDDARQVAFDYCQKLKSLFEKRLKVKAVEVGLPTF